MYRSKRKSNLFIRNSDDNYLDFKALKQPAKPVVGFYSLLRKGNEEIRERDNKNL